MKFEGTVIKYGDNVDTDVIIPARYLNTIDKKDQFFHKQNPPLLPDVCHSEKSLPIFIPKFDFMLFLSAG